MGIKEKDGKREERIAMEIVVDAYGAEEQAMGWYYYLDEKLQFPFVARCEHVEAKSPLQEGEQVTVLKMAPESECQESMWVQVEWQNRTIAVLLAQLQPIEAVESTQSAMGDWLYWVQRGYLF